MLTLHTAGPRPFAYIAMIHRARTTIGIVVVAWLGAGASSGAHEKVLETRANIGYTRERIADGVFTFVANDSYGALVSGNSTLIIGDSAALIVDTGHYPDVTRRMIEEVRSLTTKPVRYVVNTHWHPDHWMGNAAYARAYPGVTIVSTEFTRGEIQRRGAGIVAQYKDTAAILAQLRRLGASGQA